MVVNKYDCGGYGCGFQPCICDPHREQFSVYTLDGDRFAIREMSFVSAENATHIAAWLIKEAESASCPKRAAIARVIITDGGDCTVFEWERGKGVTHAR